MGFKEQVAADLSTVFLNTAEFGDLRSIDGATAVRTVLADEVDSPRAGTGTTDNPGPDGVFAVDSVLYVRVSDLPARPAVGARMSVDGKLGNVVRVAEDEGLFSIRLRWMDS